MTRAGDPWRLGAVLTFVALALACGLAPAGALARSSGALSTRLSELAKPAVRSAPEDEQAGALSVAAEGAGSLVRRGSRVLVEVRFEAGALGALEALRATGAEIVASSRRYQTVTVATAPENLHALTSIPGVASAHEVLAPVTAAAPCGAATSEGDTQLNAAAVRADLGIDGSGVTVAILSDSFNRDGTAATNATEDVADGDLPGPGNPCGRTRAVGIFGDPVIPDEATDEGRGMAQIVHDLAPGAAIDFATAFDGEIAFANSIRSLAAAGARVIVDDISYLGEPFFQDGPIAVAINEVVGEGATYFSAAGNDNLIDAGGRDIASWETPEFRDAPGCPAALEALAATEHCLDFDPGPGVDETYGITVEEKETLTVDLQWAEPWDDVSADIDAYLLDPAGQPIEEGGSPVGSFGNNVGDKGSQRPVEIFSWENPGPAQEAQLAINRCFSSVTEAEEEKGCNPDADRFVKPRLKLMLTQNGEGVTETEYPHSSGPDVVGPTVYGHSGGAGAISVAAVPYSNGATAEPYSSRGPSLHLFGPAEGKGAAAPIAPQTIAKPDIAATDCGQTSFFVPVAKTTTYRFCGTSAAAPHAAAVAALALQANPSLTPAEIRAGMEATARPVGSFGPTAVGAGLIDAVGLIGGSALPPSVSITGAPAAVSRNRSPSIAFAANRPASFSCEIDGSAPFPCTSPFTPPEPLGDGLHGFAVSGVDHSGRRGASPVASFRVDTTPPRTFFRTRPRKTIRTSGRLARAAFGFHSNEEGVQYTCRVDGGLFRFCPERLSRRFKVGRHSLRVKAVDPAGNIDATAAVYRFVVERVGSS